MKLTDPQKAALAEVGRRAVQTDAKSLGVRSDVLWRLEGMGLVRQNLAECWRITPEGERALDAMEPSTHYADEARGYPSTCGEGRDGDLMSFFRNEVTCPACLAKFGARA